MIPLYLRNGVAYVWNSEDWHTLRTKYRICGALIGSAPAFPRQNDFQGLPMELMAEEAALLADIGACELCEMPTLTEKVSDEKKLKVENLEKIALEDQMEALRQQRIHQLSEKIDIILAGKKKKLVSKGETDITLDKQAILEEEINKLPKIAPRNVLVHLPTKHHIGIEKSKVNVNRLCPDYSDNDHFVRYMIFKSLWDQGHYITNGSKFGADFLIYPGDPVKFHASFMVRCINDSKTNLRPVDLVAFGRLAVSVNKIAVLASFNTSGFVEYQTIQWHGSVNV